MATVIPNTGARYFSKIFGDNHGAPAFQYIYDSGVVWQNLNGQVITGAARPIVPADLGSTTSLSVSGLSLTVGSVAITGNPQMTVSNAILAISGAIQGGNLIPLYVTGLIDTRVTGTIGGTVTVNSVSITGSPGFTLTGLNTGLTFPISAPLGIISIDTGVRAVNVVAGALTVSSVAVTGGTSGAALGSLDLTHIYLPVSGVGTFAVTVGGTVTTNANITNTSPLAVSGFFTPIWTGAPNVTASVSIGNVAVTGGSIQTIVTGTISATVDNTALILAVASGNNLALIANQLLSGVSGSLASNLSSPAWVTGSGTQLGSLDVSHSYLSVSGVGTFAVNANITNALLAFSGNTVAQITGFNTGIVISTQPVTKTTSSNSAPSGVSPWTSLTSIQTGQIFAANANRVLFFIQNIHTGTPLYVNLGTQAASTGSFSFILNPSANLGYGGSTFSDDHYRGAVTVSGGGWINWEL